MDSAPVNVLKLNTDASWNSILNRGGIGWFLRDHVAILECLSSISIMNCSAILLSPDSISAVNLLVRKEKSLLEVDDIIDQIKL